MVRTEVPETRSVARVPRNPVIRWTQAIAWRLLYLPLEFTYKFFPFSCLVWVLLAAALVAGIVLFLNGTIRLG